MPEKKDSPKQLGQLLLENGIINKRQLETALALQKKESGLLGEKLVKLGYTTEEKIVTALAAQCGYPYLPLASYQIAPELIKIIPENVARQYYVVPVDRIGEMLTIAIADPTNTLAINDLTYITKCKIQVFVSTAGEIKQTIDHYYKSEKFLGIEDKPEEHISKVDFRSVGEKRKKEEEKRKKEDREK